MLAKLTRRLRQAPLDLTVLIATALSIFSLGHRYRYCLDGAAMGFPFPVLRPSHEGSTLVTVFVGEIAEVPSEVYLPGVIGNILFWAALAIVVLAVVPRRLYRLRPELDG